MSSLVYIIAFLFCLASALAGIAMGHRLITTYNGEFHRNYFYYLITFFGFAFYGLWVQFLMGAFLSAMNSSAEVATLVSMVLPVLGLPFLILSWIMLIKMGYSLMGAVPKNKTIWAHLGLLLIFVIATWGLYRLMGRDYWLQDRHLVYSEIGLFLFLELVYMGWFAGIILRHLKTFKKKNRKIVIQFVLLLFLGLVVRGGTLPFYHSGTWLKALVLLDYFLTNLFPLFYLNLHSDVLFTPVYAHLPNTEKKALLFQKYGISKREKEIVNKICEGKTNQQIADELFISLQTVKDHTHRIYTKIGINSRLKLVQMING